MADAETGNASGRPGASRTSRGVRPTNTFCAFCRCYGWPLKASHTLHRTDPEETPRSTPTKPQTPLLVLPKQVPPEVLKFQ